MSVSKHDLGSCLARVTAAVCALLVACSDEERSASPPKPDAAVSVFGGPQANTEEPDAATARDAQALGPEISDDDLHALAEQLGNACPAAAPDDASARERCADALSDLAALRDVAADPILWGAQPADLPLERVPRDATLTAFSPRVWRRLYLSTFTFEGPAQIEQAGDYRVLRLSIRFRNQLDAGDYPYPFWHSDKKWLSYEQSTSLLFFFEGRTLVASARSEQVDPSRDHDARSWDGAWTWNDGQEPHVTLFSALFSADNPFTAELDASYRALAVGLREQSCLSCHAPNNPANMKPLELLNYPNQGLSGRHGIVAMLEQNRMPPTVGIADDTMRLSLLDRAREFARLGDLALDFEGETTSIAP